MQITFVRNQPEAGTGFVVNLPVGADNTFIGTIGSDPDDLYESFVTSDLRPAVCKVSTDREVRSNGTTRILIRVRLTGDIVPRSDTTQTPVLAAPEAHVVFSVPPQVAGAMNTAGRNRDTARALINLLRALLVGLLTEQNGTDFTVAESRILERGVLGVRPLNADDTIECGLDYI